MALSDSTDFTLTAKGVIKAALSKIKSGGKTSLKDEHEVALLALNLLIKSLQNDNIFLWTIEWAQKTFSNPSEVLGDVDGLNYTCRRGHTATAATTPNSGANFTSFWEQTGSGGVAHVVGTVYTAIGDFEPGVDTLEVLQAYVRRDTSDDPVALIGREKYHARFDKDNTGQPIELYLQRGLIPKIFLYPQPENITDVLHYLRVKKLQDFDDINDDSDMRDSMLRWLVYALCADIADDFGLKVQERVYYQRKAEKLKLEARRGNTENETEEFVESYYP